jgi:class 3 adenylate cyclase
MALPLLNWLYRKLGKHYPAAFLTAELQSAYVIVAATLGLFTFFYDASAGDYLKTLAVVEALTVVAVWLTLARTYPRLTPIREWIAGSRGEDSTARAWSAAVGLPLHLLRYDVKIPLGIVVIPGCAAAAAFLDLAWYHYFALLAGSLVALGYSGILHYLLVESGMRPVLVDINRAVTPRLEAGPPAISLRVRLMTALPAINVITAFIVSALTSNGGGISATVLIAIAAGTAISLELSVLLSKSILRPVADLREAAERLAFGDYDFAVPVTTADELGELAATFNQVVQGLREREQIREAFGTYLDKDVAGFILSGNFPDDGIEVDVSVLIFDVRGFTEFAARAEAKEVVARLNELFEVTVPIVARHGGHVDKFVGDGLIAIFGAPESYPDHAARAVRAGCEMVRKVNDGAVGDLRIGVGINTGRVVAGSIGGAGRLNFSVIGDAVNVAARVESMTRELGEDILITEATRCELSPGFEITSRGEHRMKGIDKPVELFAPRLGAARGAQPGEEPLAVGARDGADGRRPPLGTRDPGGLAQL